jgi:antitoxin CptB
VQSRRLDVALAFDTVIETIDPRAFDRLRWRCRRGMLENDLILVRYLDRCGATMTDCDVSALTRLLELSDNDLWDVISGRLEPADAATAPLVEQLRLM